jgi:hypothetical protein
MTKDNTIEAQMKSNYSSIKKVDLIESSRYNPNNSTEKLLKRICDKLLLQKICTHILEEEIKIVVKNKILIDLD